MNCLYGGLITRLLYIDRLKLVIKYLIFRKSLKKNDNIFIENLSKGVDKPIYL